MNLRDWVTEQVKASDTPKTREAVLRDLSTVCGVHYVTLSQAERGAQLRLFLKAKAISQATGHQVTVLELCDENPTEALRLAVLHYGPPKVHDPVQV